jgi:hypothetical protein
LFEEYLNKSHERIQVYIEYKKSLDPNAKHIRSHGVDDNNDPIVLSFKKLVADYCEKKRKSVQDTLEKKVNGN